jgi:hypothetical protein
MTGQFMQTIQASEAKTHFLRILDVVERGESVLITRHGKPRLTGELSNERQKECAPCARGLASSRWMKFSLHAMRDEPDGIRPGHLGYGGLGTFR